MNNIIVNNLTKDYGSGRGVFNVSFKVNEGDVFGFLGPNGSGKSTTIRHLMGFSKPDSGETEIFGKESFDNYDSICSNVGYLPGEIALPDGLTGYEFIDMMKKLKHVENDERLNYLIKLFELDPQGETKRMSLGIKRKLAIVTAFMSDPDVLILDEPTSGLDPIMQEVFIDFVREEKKRGKTILMSSHIFSEVNATCSRIAIIKDGRIVSEFLADDLKRKSNKNYIVEFFQKDDMKEFVTLAKQNNHYKIFDINDEKKMVSLNIDDKNINELIKSLSKYKIKGFSHIKETLEDYFMSYYKEDRDFGGAL